MKRSNGWAGALWKCFVCANMMQSRLEVSRNFVCITRRGLVCRCGMNDLQSYCATYMFTLPCSLYFHFYFNWKKKKKIWMWRVVDLFLMNTKKERNCCSVWLLRSEASLWLQGIEIYVFEIYIYINVLFIENWNDVIPTDCKYLTGQEDGMKIHEQIILCKHTNVCSCNS